MTTTYNDYRYEEDDYYFMILDAAQDGLGER